MPRASAEEKSGPINLTGHTFEEVARARGPEWADQTLQALHRRERAQAAQIVQLKHDVEVAKACLFAGAKVLNLTGTAASETVYRLAAGHDAAVIVCYVAGDNARDVADIPLDDDPIPRMAEYFAREIETAERCGLAKGFVDPGLGFYYENLQDSSVRIRHQMKTFLNAFRLRELGWPVCNALPHAVECFGDEVRSAEPFFSVLAALGGTDLFRTHEVPRVRAVLKTLGVY